MTNRKKDFLRKAGAGLGFLCAMYGTYGLFQEKKALDNLRAIEDEICVLEKHLDAHVSSPTLDAVLGDTSKATELKHYRSATKEKIVLLEQTRYALRDSPEYASDVAGLIGSITQFGAGLVLGTSLLLRRSLREQREAYRRADALMSLTRD